MILRWSSVIRVNDHAVSEPMSFRNKSRAGFPFGSYEIFTLMQHMGCEPDTASYNIMVDAFGRAGLHEGKSIFLDSGICYEFFLYFVVVSNNIDYAYTITYIRRMINCFGWNNLLVVSMLDSSCNWELILFINNHLFHFLILIYICNQQASWSLLSLCAPTFLDALK